MKTIRIPQGNAFDLVVPLILAGGEHIDAALLTDLEVIVRQSHGAQVAASITANEDTAVISFENLLALGSYDCLITGKYDTRNIALPLNNVFAICEFSNDATFAERVVSNTITTEPQVLVGWYNTDAELEQLKTDYRNAKIAADAEKALYEQKVGEIENVAQQTTLTDGVAAIREDISHINIDTTTIAKQGTNASATLTATQTAATNAYASAEAAKTATIDGNDTAVGVAKEVRSEVGTGSDTAAETGTLFAVVKWVKDKVKSIFNLIGSPASGQPATLFAAIAAGGGGGSADALETEVETGKTAIADAIVQKGGTATATDSLAQLASEVENIPNVTKQFVQTAYIPQWTGSAAMDCLKIIHDYYNPLYPTAQCYAVSALSSLTIPQGADKTIYYNTSGVLTTIDNPSGTYIIGAASGENIGFCLLQYSASTISSLTLSNSQFVWSAAFYNADLTLGGFGSSSILVVQVEDCNVSFSASTFMSSQLAQFSLFGTSTMTANVSTIFNSCGNLRFVYLPTLEEVSGVSFLSNCTGLRFAYLPDLETISAIQPFTGSSALLEIYLPNCTTINAQNLANGCTKLQKLVIPKANTLGGSSFNSDTDLIDIVIGQNITSNLNLNNTAWNPTNALLTTSSSLVFAGETFANNREKLLYNLREHFAANLPDRTGQTAITITFASAMKTAINADTATKNAFINKNYTIA